MKRIRTLVTLALLAGLAGSSCALFRTRPPKYDPVMTPSGLRIQDLVVPEATEFADPGETVTIHVEGRFPEGGVFDSSYDRGTPLTFVLGQGLVPPGLDEGIVGMGLWGRRLLVVPPELGYGEAGVPPLIPGNTTLVFEIELLGIE